MRFELSRFWLFRILLCGPMLGAVVILGFAAGCREPHSSPGRQAQQAQMRRSDRSDALLDAASRQLSDLPAAVQTNLRAPAVILDASRSANRAEILAVSTASPNDPEGPVNYVIVPDGNARFRSIGVRSGDILKYYIIEDETVDQERREAGFSSRMAMDFTIAQVLDENVLLIEKGVPERIVKSQMALLAAAQSLTDAAMPRGVLIPAKIEVWRNLDDRLIEISQNMNLYIERRLPPVSWQPSPDEQVLSQIVVWLNQWLRQSEPKTDWELDPMLDTLDTDFLTNALLVPFLAAESLSADKFQPYADLQPQDARTMRDSLYDGRLLQEAVWHRDISRWAQGSNFNDLARATALFDWVVRNVQLVADEEDAAHRPWQVLLHGRGTPEQRAWVFARLCRQQGLDVVMLKTGSGQDRSQDKQNHGSQPSTLEAQDFWLPALLLDGQLYLFDTRLGMPIPGPEGKSVATLAQVRADDALLRQLDLDDAAYPMTSETLAEVVPCVVGDPFDLSRRARQVESKLTEDRLALTSRPSELAAKLSEVPKLGEPRIWEVPFRTLRDQLTLSPTAARRREALAFEPFAVRPVLWKARTRHFQGRRAVGERADEDAVDDHREAAQLYTSKSVRPTERHISQTTSANERRVDAVAKINATYWVGLLSFDDGKLDVAAHWLGRPELVAAGSPWASGARYNLARTFEAQQKLDEAIALLEADDESPQRHGNRLRARGLRARLEADTNAGVTPP